MKARRRVVGILAAAAIVSGFHAAPARAAHCNDVVMFSRLAPAQPLVFALGGVGCFAVDDNQEGVADTRYLMPGAQAVMVRFTDNAPGDVMGGWVQGPGLPQTSLTLKKETDVAGNVTFDSQWVSIDRTQLGAYEAHVFAPTGEQATVYHTPGAF